MTQETDANNDAVSSTESQSTTDDANNSPSSSDVQVKLDNEHFDPNTVNLISTVKDDIGGIDLSTGGTRSEQPAEKDVEAVATPAETGEPTVDKAEVSEEFHKNPAWQRIIKERDEAKLQIQKLKEQETAPLAEPATVGSEIGTIAELSDDDLLEMMSENPKEFAANLIKVAKDSVKGELATEAAVSKENANVDKTYDSYAEKNPSNEDQTGFVEMWSNGDIQKFIDTNPGHNPISAHMSIVDGLNAESAKANQQKAIDNAVAEAVKKTKADMVKQQRARVITDGLSGGPGYAPSGEDEGLKDTKKAGGTVSVLAERLARRRQAV